jgi:hypothetical protein
MEFSATDGVDVYVGGNGLLMPSEVDGRDLALLNVTKAFAAEIHVGMLSPLPIETGVRRAVRTIRTDNNTAIDVGRINVLGLAIL